MNYFNEEKEMKKDFTGEFTCSSNPCIASPIMECPQERVCHRYICHEVPHIMPCNTRIINHHIYKHTFTPEYTCSEENVCENIYGPRCC